MRSEKEIKDKIEKLKIMLNLRNEDGLNIRFAQEKKWSEQLDLLNWVLGDENIHILNSQLKKMSLSPLRDSILLYARESTKPFTTREVALKIDKNQVGIRACLKKMVMDGLLKDVSTSRTPRYFLK